MNRKVVEKVLALMFQAFVPSKFWINAFRITVFIMSRLPSKFLNFKTPYELLYNKIPNYDFLHMFGSHCFPCIRTYIAHKMDLRLIHCVFLGYGPYKIGYLRYDPMVKNFYSFRHVIFHEVMFLSYIPLSLIVCLIPLI